MFMMKGTTMGAAWLNAVAVSIGLSLSIGMSSLAQAQGQHLPGVSIKITPSSTSISSGETLSVSVTLTNSSGRTLSLDSCEANRTLAVVSVQNAAGKSPPMKSDAFRILCSSRGESTPIPSGSSITVSGSVTAAWDLSQTGVYSLSKTVELYDQALQKYTYTAVPVHVTVVQP
jgi:hypothetical protein